MKRGQSRIFQSRCIKNQDDYVEVMLVERWNSIYEVINISDYFNNWLQKLSSFFNEIGESVSQD